MCRDAGSVGVVMPETWVCRDIGARWNSRARQAPAGGSGAFAGSGRRKRGTRKQVASRRTSGFGGKVSPVSGGSRRGSGETYKHVCLHPDISNSRAKSAKSREPVRSPSPPGIFRAICKMPSFIAMQSAEWFVRRTPGRASERTGGWNDLHFREIPVPSPGKPARPNRPAARCHLATKGGTPQWHAPCPSPCEPPTRSPRRCRSH